MTQSIEKSFLIDPLTTNNAIYSLILIGDFNIDFKNKGARFDKLSEIAFNCGNLISPETCYNLKSLINLFFASKPLFFKKLMSPKMG